MRLFFFSFPSLCADENENWSNISLGQTFRFAQFSFSFLIGQTFWPISIELPPQEKKKEKKRGAHLGDAAPINDPHLGDAAVSKFEFFRKRGYFFFFF